jgi:putative oxidoreductase
MKRVLFDIAALISRVVIGVIFLAHGWQKWQGGLSATAGMFGESGVPMPQLAAGFVTVAETVGGILLIIGLLVRPAALVLLVVAIGAIVFVHAPNGIFVQQGGWELVGALGAASLLFLALGGGRLSVDGILSGVFRRRAERRAAEREAGTGMLDRPGPDTRTTYADEPRRPADTRADYDEPRRPTDTRADYDEPRRPETGTRAAYPDDPRAGDGPTEPHAVPRQPTEQQRSAGLSDQDMRDVDALVNDEPTRPKPPNR